MVYFSAIAILTKLCELKDIRILSPSSLFFGFTDIPLSAAEIFFGVEGTGGNH
jgi:hypothetical protein